ncbi:MAG: glycosyltransferase family 4 protein [Verrucomicrobiae bacterium]|nr:glycosyltransferase family 4 protein [Verrucomicrobiae bacterium]
MATIKNWKAGRSIEPQRIGFVSTRFAGTDGVSLESAKWAQVLADDQHQCFWYAGRLDTRPETSLCVPEAFFGHPENEWINGRIWGRTAREPLVSDRIREMAGYLKETLHDFIRRFDLKILVFENVQTIPMHVPLGVAIAELMSETHIPAIAHHHDFYWERTRYSVNAVNDLLDMAFPSRDHDLQHVVINHAAQEELARRKAVPSLLIPNVLDFENPPPPPDAYASDIWTEIGLGRDDILILQPTRIVPRKGIEHAIDLVRRLNNPQYKLVITHEAGDEGLEYRSMLVKYARQAGVDMRFVATRITDRRQINREGKKTYALWDIYPHASLITYPSLYEGFGNAYLEAVYFKKPVLVNHYSIFHRDIEPKGFRGPVMDGYLTDEVVDEVRRVLEDSGHRQKMVDHNYRLARKYFSYAELRRCLRTLIINISNLYPDK